MKITIRKGEKYVITKEIWSIVQKAKVVSPVVRFFTGGHFLGVAEDTEIDPLPEVFPKGTPRPMLVIINRIVKLTSQFIEIHFYSISIEALNYVPNINEQVHSITIYDDRTIRLPKNHKN